jgi:hypothetical protein
MTRFAFADRSSARASALESRRSIGYVIEDEHICRLSGAHLSSRAADLISIALSCYTVDRLEPRGARWSRDLEVAIPVSDPGFWSARSRAIQDFLHDLTDDPWALEFVHGRRWRSAEQQLQLFPRRLSPESSLGLFSGGLDSLAGAVRFLANSTRPLVLLGIRSSYVIGCDQGILVDQLQRTWPERVLYLRVPMRLQRAGDGEQTQRVRAFVYLTLAAIAATNAGLSSFSVYENGIGAYNPRVAEFQWGSQANLSTHPQTLSRFSRLMHNLEIPIDVLLPHRLETKAEHVARMPHIARRLIALTASCDSYPLRRPGVTHCGVKCASCILRRQSLVAAGLERYDRTDYDELAFEPGSRTEAYRLAAWQAWRFTRLDPDDEQTVRRLWPSLADVSAAEQSAVIGLVKRYGREWASIIDRRPQVGRDCGWPVAQVA